MILCTRLNGVAIYLNPDLIERLEANPETVVSLVDGKKYVVVEDPQEIIRRIVSFRAAVLTMAESGSGDFGGPPAALAVPRPLRLIEDQPVTDR